MIFIRISVFWQALFIFRVLINLVTSLEVVSLKVKLVSKPFLFYNTGLIFEIAECFFRWVITFIVRKIWNTWNFMFLDCFWKKVTKNSTQFTIAWDNFIFWPKFFIVKIFLVPIVYYFRWQFLETILNSVMVNKWKSKSPVSKALLCWKQFGWLIKKRSMHVDLSGFLKHVGF